jgi:hypothetical protein
MLRLPLTTVSLIQLTPETQPEQHKISIKATKRDAIDSPPCPSHMDYCPTYQSHPATNNPPHPSKCQMFLLVTEKDARVMHNSAIVFHLSAQHHENHVLS